MIVPGGHRIPQRRKPCTLNQGGVSRELSLGDAASIQCGDVLRVRFQSPVLNRQRLLDQGFDLLRCLRIYRLMRSIDEIVVCVFPGAECSKAVQLMEQHSI